jgi:type II secretory pathway component PulF
MATFKYKGRTATGAAKEASVEAGSLEAARRILKRQGIRVTALEEATQKESVDPHKAKVKPLEIMMFTRQLATMIKAGVPILTSVRSIRQQVESATLAAILERVDNSITGGKPLSQALTGYPNAFTELYVNIVIAGEIGGVLPEVLTRLANLIERDHEITSEVKGALRYPTYVTVALVGAFVFLINFVVPKFSAMFKKFDLDLPLPTRILMAISDSMQAYWFVYSVSAISIFIAWRYFKKSTLGKSLLDRLVLKLPIVGKVTLKYSMARFASLMSTLIRSGVPALNCLDIVRKTMENTVIEKEFQKVRNRVESGSPIHDYMKESPVIPPLMTNMIKIGEDSGSLESMLDTIAEHYEMETRYAVKTLTGLIEPVMTVVTGCMVLTLALAIFMPMWDMMKAARQH